MTYTLDSNILIGLVQRYPRDIFPGIWDSIEESVARGESCICEAVHLRSGASAKRCICEAVHLLDERRRTCDRECDRAGASRMGPGPVERG
ncbi:hypothetical protein [Brevibacterium sp.]|uniref:hypothetical protein n=1 Tax=Brevibacterium sp. TaxID=1701 RepID=UPI002811ADAC|nr:hypothetical protein [Brevibacterium sp.]